MGNDTPPPPGYVAAPPGPPGYAAAPPGYAPQPPGYAAAPPGYAPPPPGYAPAPAQGYAIQPAPGYGPPGQPIMVTTMVTTAPASMPTWWPSYPVDCVCSGCGQKVQTRIAKETGLGTWLIAGGVCFVGCIPCCLIPFCVDSCKDTVHTCPNCNKFLGMNKMV